MAISIAGDADSPIPSYLVQTIRSLAPLIVARGTATAEEVARDGYLQALTEQTRALAAMTVRARLTVVNSCTDLENFYDFKPGGFLRWN
ncbi:MAG: hypothetical protein JWO75_6231 [Actinomycetia bacterium]|nr:hypothetical protein [Actinomycetes bacterium]